MEDSLARFKPTKNIGNFQSESYGDGVELDNLQRSADMFVQDTVDAELTDAQQVNTGRDVVQNVYRGTDRLGESLAANQLQDQYGMGVMEANMILRAMYRVLPSKDILALMDEDIIPGG
jgi:hypothetical protein